jgi:hypothetical protein
MRNARMQDDDLGFVALDPAKLSPFWGILEQSNPEATKHPPKFIAGADDLYTGSKIS